MIDDKVLYQFRFSINHCPSSLEQNSTIRFVYDKAQEGVVYDDFERRSRAGHVN